MISGANLRLALAVLWLLAATQAGWARTDGIQTDAVPTAAGPAGWGVGALMQALAQTRSATVAFTESQSSPVLSTPLVSTGTLSYVAPDYMRKATLSPAPNVFTLDHDQVTLTNGTDAGTHVFNLRQDPRIAGLVEGIRATLAGDLPTLEHFYSLSLTGDAADWQLKLRPKDPALAQFVRLIVISGRQGRIALIDTTSNDGSESQMSIKADDAP
ncbi:MAG: hypothetical protein B7Z75_11855 [Acidocella sp. 20-57-95]|nr:MAG: hypothetical protein B7Z75_11855 [Acidocella sp. 20-57-95]OYV62661.1 MAG: hypothetical protein B7Z71_00265 [Acidocella sp. 21-58-7]HQT63162.1 hypothetical protein [Acidocella sp.]HQU03318.1 hypothetical protein [Acidocella sp.]